MFIYRVVPLFFFNDLQQFLAVGIRPVKNVIAVYTNAQQSVDTPEWSISTSFTSSGGSNTINVWIDNGCTGGNELNIYYSLSSTTKPSSPQLVASTSGALFNTAPSGGSKDFYVGFTAGSGGDYSTIQVDNFYFNSYSNNACSLSCPAATTGAQCYGTAYNLSDFSSASLAASSPEGFTLNGNAFIASNLLQLTNNTGSQAGSAFFVEPFNAQCNECFSGYYQATIDECGSSNNCADGVLMVLSSAATTYVGGSGDSLGFLGTSQAYLAVGIEVYGTPKVYKYFFFIVYYCLFIYYLLIF